MSPHLATELSYLALLFSLFVIPKALQRFRIPSAITSFALGTAAMHLGLFEGDATVALLSVLGISGLFLFAGLEVELRDLRRGAALILQHLAVQVALMILVTRAFMWLFRLDWRPSTLLALALVTPSTGFILDSLPSFGLTASQQLWTRTKAIATEIVALGMLFVVLQSTSPVRFGIASLALGALVLVVPALMRVFARLVAPYAPRSEFAFLVMLAVTAAYATRELGVYYLVGAFIVGVAARRFRDRLPALSSDRMLHAVEVFASLFAPFYFFSAGTHISPGELSLASMATAAGYLAVVVPLRVGTVLLHRRIALGEPWSAGGRVGLALLPTLVFSLVIAGILRERFFVPEWLVGGIVPYTVVNTMLPAFLLKTAPASFDAPVLEGDMPAGAGSQVEPSRAPDPHDLGGLGPAGSPDGR